MKYFGIVLFVIGIIGLFNLTGADEGSGMIAFACLLGILALMSNAAKQNKSENK